MAEKKGNSNEITRQYLDSLLIETRYMNSSSPDLTMNLYGKTFPSPVMTAIKDGGADGVVKYLEEVNAGLAKAMAYTGCCQLSKMDPSVIHCSDTYTYR